MLDRRRVGPPYLVALSLILGLTLGACDGDPDVDAGSPMDAGSRVDAGGSGGDAGSVDAGGDGGAADGAAADGSADAGGSDAGSSDAGGSDASTGPDAGETDAGGRTDTGPIQCRNDMPCDGPTAMCNRAAPGGICLGCGTDADCPGGESCLVAACVQTGCSDDSECNAGFRCSPVGGGRCVQKRSCTADAECGPYDCNSEGVCERWRCATTACPAPFVCDAGICMEP